MKELIIIALAILLIVLIRHFVTENNFYYNVLILVLCCILLGLNKVISEEFFGLDDAITVVNDPPLESVEENNEPGHSPPNEVNCIKDDTKQDYKKCDIKLFKDDSETSNMLINRINELRINSRDNINYQEFDVKETTVSCPDCNDNQLTVPVVMVNGVSKKYNDLNLTADQEVIRSFVNKIDDDCRTFNSKFASVESNQSSSLSKTSQSSSSVQQTPQSTQTSTSEQNSTSEQTNQTEQANSTEQTGQSTEAPQEQNNQTDQSEQTSNNNQSTQNNGNLVDWEQAILDNHNKVRSNCSSDTGPLEWDPTIASYASNHAKYIANKGQMEHSDSYGEGRKYGENLAYMGGSLNDDLIKDAITKGSVNGWANEGWDRVYNAEKGQDMNACGVKGGQCGHYTAMNWKDANKLGCGYAVSQDNTKVFTVCNYKSENGVAPNMGGRFLDKVKCTKKLGNV